MTKRYSDEEIKRIRLWASGSMFVIMLILCAGVGKVAYWIGHQNGYVEGYNDRMNDDVVNPVTSFVPAAPKAIAARLDITPIPETNLSGQENHPGCWKCQLRNTVNGIIQYWFVACIAVAIWAFYMFATYPRRNVARVKGEGNVIIQSHQHSSNS